MKKLYQETINDALPQATHDYYLSDHKITGLNCRILPSGFKTYYYRYTSPVDQKRTRIKIGNANVLKLEEARDIARKYRFDVMNDIDPQLSVQEQIEEQKIGSRKKYKIDKSYEILSDFLESFDKEYIKIKQNLSYSDIHINNLKLIIEFKGDK